MRRWAPDALRKTRASAATRLLMALAAPVTRAAPVGVSTMPGGVRTADASDGAGGDRSRTSARACVCRRTGPGRLAHRPFEPVLDLESEHVEDQARRVAAVALPGECGERQRLHRHQLLAV